MRDYYTPKPVENGRKLPREAFVRTTDMGQMKGHLNGAVVREFGTPTNANRREALEWLASLDPALWYVGRRSEISRADVESYKKEHGHG